MKVRFVGGPLDGQTEDVAEGITTVRALEMVSPPVAKFYGPDDPMPNIWDPDSPEYQMRHMTREVAYHLTGGSVDGLRIMAAT